MNIYCIKNSQSGREIVKETNYYSMWEYMYRPEAPKSDCGVPWRGPQKRVMSRNNQAKR